MQECQSDATDPDILALLRWTSFGPVYNPLLGQRIGMYSDPLNNRRIHRSVGHALLRSTLHRQAFHGIQCVPPLQHPTKYRIDIIEMGLSLIRYEKLRSVGTRTLVGHAEHSAPIVDIVGMEFIIKRAAPYAFPALACAGGIPTLHHETLHVAMKYCAVVVT